MNLLRLVIDGPNYGGKSTLSELIKNMFPGMTIIEYHDFFHQHIIRQRSSEIDLSEKMHWAVLKKSERENALRYLNKRDAAVLKLVTACQYDNILLERFILTKFVYAELLFNNDLSEQFQLDENTLISNRLSLIYVTAPPKTLIQRSLIKNSKKSIRLRPKTPYHLLDQDTIVKKYDLYEKYFNQLTQLTRIRIDTSFKLEEIKPRLHNFIINHTDKN